MTGLVTVLLLGAALVVAWPVRAVRARRRAVLGTTSRPGPDPAVPRPSAGRRVSPHGRRGGQPTLDRPLPARPPNRRDSAHPAAAHRLEVAAGPYLAAGSLRSLPGVPAPAGPWRDGAMPMSPLDDRAGDGTPSPARVSATGAARTLSASGPADAAAGTFPVTDLPSGSGSVDRRAWGRVMALAPRHTGLAAILLGGGAGVVLGGPVAALVLAAYAALGARAVRRRHVGRAADQARRRELDQLCTLAADLRAGLPVTLALVDGPDRVARLARAAVRLADRTGAPLAELLERVEADARATDRGFAAAGAQAAGARATAWLLAALPLGGIGLGYAIGVDPVTVLLHTPVGGGSALAAVALQIGGLLWAERLGATPGRTD
ncbi:hypothetical protein ONA70_26205 [Micromonospora yasonensis]|uniref:hypothetical protein n=1 Tax=Micromonospora yasonensis TaxID=1128667 RepID=UPI00222E6A85|nr:hypothetical protein [Micromonospora yasonensis]MCW3843602.1 hypothetical protein [Micromonospora yasonensis]